MKTVELVSHCYAVRLPHYAQALCYQLGSLVLDKPKKCNVVATVCAAPDDERTQRVIDWAVGIGVNVKVIPLEISRLGRRSIGRNIAAKSSQADLIWYSDCDQVYREGVLDRLLDVEWPADVLMVYPRRIKINALYEVGDKTTALIGDTPQLLDINPLEFIEKRYIRAIGGVQIVEGDTARTYGYLDNIEKWQRGTDGVFASCRCDQSYRKFLKKHGRIMAVKLPGMYRIRHTIMGRRLPE